MTGVNRVKFFSTADLSVPYYFERIENVISNFANNKSKYTINDIIELYNIQLFFESKIYSNNWTDEEITEFKQVVQRDFPKCIGMFMSKLPFDKIDHIFSTVETKYTKNLWELIANYKVYKKIKPSSFISLIESGNLGLRQVLSHKELVQHYSKEIFEHMKDNINVAPILISYYFEENKGKQVPLFFPESLSSEFVNIIDSYIEHDDANSNYLKLIYNSSKDSDLKLPDITKLKAKRKYDKNVERYFNISRGFGYSISVLFSDEVDEAKAADFNIIRIEDNELQYKLEYSLSWIVENLDNPTILNNFIYLFEYTDVQFRSRHVSRRSQLSFFESSIEVRGKKDYPIGVAFDISNSTAQVQIINYSNLLKNNEINLEDVFQWFFNEYLNEEFNIQGYMFNKSSDKSTYLEKCRHLGPEIESILKQFELYSKYKEIDQELLEMSSSQLSIKNIPSILENKYIYPIGKDYEYIEHLIFSSQSPMAFLSGFEENDEFFYGLIMNNEISINVLREHHKEYINLLESFDVLYIDANKVIRPNKEKLMILNQLYEYGYICLHYFKGYMKVINEFEKMGLVEFDSTLFSRPEQDYYNFLLNKSEFSNGLDLRNRYLHGSQKTNDTQNYSDYFVFLRIIVLIIIKINEEFCLKDSYNKSN